MLRRWRHVHVMSHGHDVTQSWSNLIESYLWCESRRILSFIPKRNILVDLWLNYSEKEHSNLFCIFFPVFRSISSILKKRIPKKNIFLYSVSPFHKKPSPYSKKAESEKVILKKSIFYILCVYSKKNHLRIPKRHMQSAFIPKKPKFYILGKYSEKVKFPFRKKHFSPHEGPKREA